MCPIVQINLEAIDRLVMTGMIQKSFHKSFQESFHRSNSLSSGHSNYCFVGAAVSETTTEVRINIQIY